MLECVMNVSCAAGSTLDRLVATAATTVLDVHSDADHNRAVLTLAGDAVEAEARRVAAEAVVRIDLRTHTGAHPRFGVLDVVPFVALDGSTARDAIAARHRFARWAADELSLPCFLYGPERTLPEVRRRAFVDLRPDTGPATPHETAGACAVGARGVLVAYNLWLAEPDLPTAKRIASQLRDPHVRALGLQVGGEVQVSLNLVEPATFGPGAAYDAVAARAPVARAELVGLLPRRVLLAEPEARWELLDISEDRTIEARLGR